MGVKYSWKNACTCIMVIMLYTKQLIAGFGKIRWHGSFNGHLSGKSFLLAAFIFCHFTNSMCVCACAHVSNCSLCAGKQEVFPKICTCPRKSAQICVGNELQSADERNWSCLSAHPSLPPSFLSSLTLSSLQTDSTSVLCFSTFIDLFI